MFAPPTPTEEWIARETKDGRDAYHAGLPYDYLNTLWWKRAWIAAAHDAALKALAAEAGA